MNKKRKRKPPTFRKKIRSSHCSTCYEYVTFKEYEGTRYKYYKCPTCDDLFPFSGWTKYVIRRLSKSQKISRFFKRIKRWCNERARKIFKRYTL